MDVVNEGGGDLASGGAPGRVMGYGVASVQPSSVYLGEFAAPVEDLPVVVGRPVEPQQPDTDDTLIRLWLHGKSEHTQRSYARDICDFRVFADCDLRVVGLGLLQAWVDSEAMQAKAPGSRVRAIASVKSLLTFGVRTGYLALNPGAALKTPRLKDTLAERILEETTVHDMIALEPNPRNKILLRLLYAAGIRVSELVGLTFADVVARAEGKGQVTVYGKGGKTRAVVLGASVFAALMAIKPKDAKPTDPVFRSRQGGRGLHTAQVLNIVRAAAKRAGIDLAVSPHWLRHAHASHSLDRGAPISLVQATLGHSSMATTGRYTHARPSASSGDYLAA